MCQAVRRHEHFRQFVTSIIGVRAYYLFYLVCVIVRINKWGEMGINLPDFFVVFECI